MLEESGELSGLGRGGSADPTQNLTRWLGLNGPIGPIWNEFISGCSPLKREDWAQSTGWIFVNRCLFPSFRTTFTLHSPHHRYRYAISSSSVYLSLLQLAVGRRRGRRPANRGCGEPGRRSYIGFGRDGDAGEGDLHGGLLDPRDGAGDRPAW